MLGGFVDNRQTIFNAILKELDALTRISIDLELMNDDIKDPHIRRALMDGVAQVKDRVEMLNVYASIYPKT